MLYRSIDVFVEGEKKCQIQDVDVPQTGQELLIPGIGPQDNYVVEEVKRKYRPLKEHDKKTYFVPDNHQIHVKPVD